MEHNGFEYVDLGLSVYWATMNVGAINEYDGGLYFRWGDTVGYTENDVKNNVINTLAPIPTDENLKKENDAAHAFMGGNWRMPTEDECKEFTDMRSQAKVDLIYHEHYGHVYDICVNGKHILFPSSGYVDRDGKKLCKNDHGTFIWSNHTKIINECGTKIQQLSCGMAIMGIVGRVDVVNYLPRFGHSIRAVLPKNRILWNY